MDPTICIHDFINQHQDVATAIRLLDRWITKTTHSAHQPGLAIGIVHDGKLIWGKGYGFADIEAKTPVTLDTLFRIASITKTFTATAIMQLYEEGKLRLDDRVCDYLDWFDLHHGDAPRMTIRNLLTHTSGLPRDATIPHWTDNKFQTWDELVEATKQRKLILPPDKDFSYSNLGYSLLGRIVEVVSGDSWADYIQSHILAPLKMTDTLVIPTGDEANLATGYLVHDDDYVRQPAPFAATKNPSRR